MLGHYATAEQINEYPIFHYASDERALPWEFGPHRALDNLAEITNPGAS
jgi:hypothetical protein